MAYPTGEDLQERIQSLRVINPDRFADVVALLGLSDKAEAAWRDWERDTGYTPFLADSAATLRRFDPPADGYALDLQGAAYTVTAVAVGYDTTDGGTACTVEDDYVLTDMAGRYQAPYETVRFLSRVTGDPGSVAVTGRWGCCLTLPGSVKEALLQYGCWLAWQELSLNISRGTFSMRDMNSEIRFGGGGTTPLSVQGAGWLAAYDRAVLRHKRVVL